jgi:hypothetical protein
MHGMQKVSGSNPLSSTIFRMPIRGESANLLALDHGLTWANAQPHIVVSHADGGGARTGLIVLKSQAMWCQFRLVGPLASSCPRTSATVARSATRADQAARAQRVLQISIRRLCALIDRSCVTGVR